MPGRSSSDPQPSHSPPHIFSRRQLIILLLCNKDITPLPQLSGLKVLACLLSLILQLGFLLQFNLSCLPELTQPRAYARQFSPFHPPSMITPINPGKLECELMGHPDCSVADYARTSLCHGFHLGFNRTAVSFRSASLNMSSALLEPEVTDITCWPKWIEGRIAAPFPTLPLTNLHTSRFGVIP